MTILTTKVKYDDNGKLKTRRKEDMALDVKGQEVDKVMEHLMSQMTHTVVI